MNKFKKFLSAFLTLAMCSGLGGTVFASTTTIDNNIEPGNIILSTTSKKVLTKSDLIKEAEIIEEAFDAIGNLEPNETIKLSDGQTTVTRETVVSTPVLVDTNGIVAFSEKGRLVEGWTYDYTAQETFSIKQLGVTVLAFTGEVKYTFVAGQKVIGVKDSNIWCSKNLNPVLTVDISSPTGSYYDKNKAYAKASITIGVGWESLDIDASSGTFTVFGDYNAESDCEWKAIK